MMIEFEKLGTNLIIFERGNYETPILILRDFQIKELKRVVEG